MRQTAFADLWPLDPNTCEHDWSDWRPYGEHEAHVCNRCQVTMVRVSVVIEIPAVAPTEAKDR